MQKIWKPTEERGERGERRGYLSMLHKHNKHTSTTKSTTKATKKKKKPLCWVGTLLSVTTFGTTTHPELRDETHAIITNLWDYHPSGITVKSEKANRGAHSVH